MKLLRKTLKVTGKSSSPAFYPFCRPKAIHRRYLLVWSTLLWAKCYFSCSLTGRYCSPPTIQAKKKQNSAERTESPWDAESVLLLMLSWRQCIFTIRCLFHCWSKLHYRPLLILHATKQALCQSCSFPILHIEGRPRFVWLAINITIWLT